MLDSQAISYARARVCSPEPTTTSNLWLIAALLSIAKSTRALHGLKLGNHGFANGQDELLIAIPEGGISVTALADLLMVRPSTVSKMADRVLEKGLIERAEDKKDARRTIVRITPSGIEARETLMQARRELEEELVHSLDKGALSTLEVSLEDCASLLAKRLRRLR